LIADINQSIYTQTTTPQQQPHNTHNTTTPQTTTMNHTCPNELVHALKENGFAKPSVTLQYVYSNTLQDAQYSPDASKNASVLRQYIERYGNMTVQEIKELYFELA
jgi:hypothetical protein